MSNRRPYLFDAHLELGARIVPFGGWEMPLHYADGTLKEHLRCRHDSVVFDVSHLGTVRCEGPNTFGALQTTLTNDLTKISPGRAQYTHLLDEDGFVVDDIIVWWIDENTFDVMPNASNTSGVTEALPGVDVTDTRCVLAVQGPRSLERCSHFDPRFADVRRNSVQRLDFEGSTITVSGTGYTGEIGCEISVPLDVAESLLHKIVASGVSPAGLGARDTLRLESALPLYGHELSRSSTTLEAKLGWVLGWTKDTFRGRDAVLRERETGPRRHLTGVVTHTRQPLREGGVVRYDGKAIGTLTSGNFSPILERGIGLALCEVDLVPETPLTIEMRGRSFDALVCALPFVRKNS